MVPLDQLFKRRKLRDRFCTREHLRQQHRFEGRGSNRRSGKPHLRLDGPIRLPIEFEAEFPTSQAVFHVRYVRVVTRELVQQVAICGNRGSGGPRKFRHGIGLRLVAHPVQANLPDLLFAPVLGSRVHWKLGVHEGILPNRRRLDRRLHEIETFSAERPGPAY